MANVHQGTCFCGAVEIRVTGEPVGMGYCHCRSCRQWSASPVNAFTLWKPEAVDVVRGRAYVGEYHRSERSHRKFCRQCGGHLMTEHPAWGLIDVYAATIPTLPFKPGVHVNYEDHVLPMADGLPKLKDFPKELGGSGEVVPG
ncbi:MAG: GFA family protein [Myxococcales bacterium]